MGWGGGEGGGGRIATNSVISSFLFSGGFTVDMWSASAMRNSSSVLRAHMMLVVSLLDTVHTSLEFRV